MNEHTDEELLRLCLEGELPEELRRLAASPDGARVRTAIELARVLPDLPLEEPPAALRRSVRELGKRRLDLRVLLAKLWTPPAELAPAFRGAAAVPSTYQAGPFELDVTLTSGGALVGELVATEEGTEQPGVGLCSLFGADFHSAELGPDGGFHMANVKPGDYRLVIDLADETVIVCELSL